MSEAVEPVDTQGIEELSRLEAIIRRGKDTFIEVGRALQSVKEGKLYRQVGFATFEDYCFQRWGFTRDTAYKYLRASDVVANVEPVIQTTPPAYRQALELASLPAEQQREVAAALDFNSATVADVREAVKERKESTLMQSIRASAPEGTRFHGDPIEPDPQPSPQIKDQDRWDRAFRILEDVAGLAARAGRKDVSYQKWPESQKASRLALAQKIAPHLKEWIALMEEAT